MIPNRFEHLLTLVRPLIEKRTTRFREPISASQRLALRFLATGESQQSLSFSYRFGKAAVSKLCLKHRLQYTIL